LPVRSDGVSRPTRALQLGTTAGDAYARYRFPLETLSLFALLFTRMLPTGCSSPPSS
jgi:ABC-type glycerol-3-phosphate transport system permease component